MTHSLPLLQGHRLDSPLAWHDGEVVTAGRFLAHAEALAETLTSARQVINLCEDRYSFLLGFCAALLCGRTTLLPPNRAEETIETLLQENGECLLLSDRPQEYARFGCLDIRLPIPDGSAEAIPLVAADYPALTLYTSGSSGIPIPHQKSWGMLVAGARLTGERLAIATGTTLLATVPPQHMFGLEASVMLALQYGCAIDHRRPLFPADILAALESLPAPRTLITTPLQLRACAGAGLRLPPCSFILSATAPLEAQLAREVEARYDTTVKEIYGSTETGAIATRDTATQTSWLLLPGHTLEQRGDDWWHHSPYQPAPQRLADRVQREGERFTLLGRSGDLIKVAGKRVSLGELNHILLSIEGVEDGLFFLPHGRGDGSTTRLAAVVVTHTLDEGELNARLRQHIDAAFMPRPLMLLERLPRNEVGKLPYQTLKKLIAQHHNRS